MTCANALLLPPWVRPNSSPAASMIVPVDANKVASSARRSRSRCSGRWRCSGSCSPAAPLFFLGLAVELLGMAVLALVPLPPLPGWRLLELASTGSVGWQRAREYLVEKNLGVLALLVLLILPLGGSTPLLLGIVDTVVGSLLNIAS